MRYLTRALLSICWVLLQAVCAGVAGTATFILIDRLLHRAHPGILLLLAGSAIAVEMLVLRLLDEASPDGHWRFWQVPRPAKDCPRCGLPRGKFDAISAEGPLSHDNTLEQHPPRHP